jgi:hydroxypyruvate reductase 2
MKPIVLLAGAQQAFIIERLRELYDLQEPTDLRPMPKLLAEVGPRIRGIATGAHFPLTSAVIDACPNLEIISSFGVGTDAIDVNHARKRGVIVCNTPGVLDEDVANLAVTLLLTTTRRFVAYDRYVREGRWANEGAPALTTSIAGRRIGIVGLGRIGLVIARKLEAFHCDIAYHARNRREAPYHYYPDLVEMARDSLALIVIVPGGRETEKLIDRAVIDALGSKGILINVSRGSVVDEDELVAALRDGRLGGAGLDVFAKEPIVPASLLTMDNVVLQPHQGSATVETRRAMGELMLANLAAHFEGKKPPSPL